MVGILQSLNKPGPAKFSIDMCISCPQPRRGVCACTYAREIAFLLPLQPSNSLLGLKNEIKSFISEWMNAHKCEY